MTVFPQSAGSDLCKILIPQRKIAKQASFGGLAATFSR